MARELTPSSPSSPSSLRLPCLVRNGDKLLASGMIELMDVLVLFF